MRSCQIAVEEGGRREERLNFKFERGCWLRTLAFKLLPILETRNEHVKQPERSFATTPTDAECSTLLHLRCQLAVPTCTLISIRLLWEKLRLILAFLAVTFLLSAETLPLAVAASLLGQPCWPALLLRTELVHGNESSSTTLK